MKTIAAILFVSLSGCLMSQDATPLLQTIDQKLQQGKTTVSEVLCDTAWMALHAQPDFREVIKRHAKAGKFRMVADNEPGTRITVRGQVVGSNGRPLRDLLVYAYQTSDKGWYSDTAAHILVREGDMRHARLFAYFKTDSEGRFEYETIMPKGYPRSDLPAHIHIAVWYGGKYVRGIPGELLFEEDPRLTPERRERAFQDGFLIAGNTGTAKTPVYFYRIETKGFRQE